MQSRTRTVTVQPKYGGKTCPLLEDSQKCAEIDCKVSEWSDWSQCAPAEGGLIGFFGNVIHREIWEQKATRTVTQEAQYGGRRCPDLTKTKWCKPVNCEVSTWSEWSACAKNDQGVWEKTQTRTVTTQPQYGGDKCPDLVQHQTCPAEDCKVSDFGKWSPCALGDDGPWLRHHSRVVTSEPKYGGKACPNLDEGEVCAPIHCQLSDWSAWSDCTEGDGGKWYKKQTRSVIVSPQYGGNACGPLAQTLDCPARDCTVSEWSPWVCNGDRQTRTRTIVSPAVYGGKCPSLTEEGDCPPVLCQLGDWSEWSCCNEGTGQRTRTRPVLQQPLHGAPKCDVTEQYKDCDPEPCVLSDWGQWGPCDKLGVQRRTRKVDRPAKWKGAECGPTEEQRDCPPENCVVSDWSEWSACDHTCGHKTRTRHVIHSPRFHGSECPWLEEKANCDPVPCKVSEWSGWSGCNCKTGLRTRKRTVLEYPRYGGKSCPTQEENQKCNPVDCVLSEWSDWSGCNSQTKLQTRTRNVLTYPQDGGLACGKTTETRKCEKVDCKLSDWSDWSACDESCGMKTRWREVLQFPEYGGAECSGKLSESVTCDPMPCKLSDEYLPWGTCSQSTCMQRAERKIIDFAKYGGTECSAIPGFVKEQRCFEGRCARFQTL
ncbi:TPA: hypothetical protein N0F65_005804 [Lagenidium giganteum]|uniref:Spondin-like TSP1 domain-containing protein n=1 Tax=Lagenidium giganteum TaxID=4803 RepID=A0AAV2YRJ3_9STRA|nr:TPA: hypothetical protein N0F65_005804 [Lagenidium giganteum]